MKLPCEFCFVSLHPTVPRHEPTFIIGDVYATADENSGTLIDYPRKQQKCQRAIPEMRRKAVFFGKTVLIFDFGRISFLGSQCFGKVCRSFFVQEHGSAMKRDTRNPVQVIEGVCSP